MVILIQSRSFLLGQVLLSYLLSMTLFRFKYCHPDERREEGSRILNDYILYRKGDYRACSLHFAWEEREPRKDKKGN